MKKKKIFIPIIIILVVIAMISVGGYLAVNSRLLKIKIAKI